MNIHMHRQRDERRELTHARALPLIQRNRFIRHLSLQSDTASLTAKTHRTIPEAPETVIPTVRLRGLTALHAYWSPLQLSWEAQRGDRLQTETSDTRE